MPDIDRAGASPSSPQMATVTGCDKGSDSASQSGRGTAASPTDKPVRAAWQDIKTAPQSRGAYLVYCPDRMNTYIVVWRDEEAWGMPGWFHFGGGTNARLTEEPSHWQSLPGNPGLSGEEAIGPSSLRPAPSEPTSDPSLIAQIRGYREALETLSDLTNGFLIYLVEGDDRVYLRIDGVTIATAVQDSDLGSALLRLEAKQRAAVAALQAAGTSDPGNGGIAARGGEAHA
jgi:hypothetical protein